MIERGPFGGVLKLPDWLSQVVDKIEIGSLRQSP